MAPTISKITPQFDPRLEEKQDNHNVKRCVRCGGMLVDDQCYDLLGNGIFKIPIKRCIQCGDVIDSVILQHRCHSTLS